MPSDRLISRLALLVPIPALVAGIITMAGSHVPAPIWTRNIATAAAGILLCEVAYRTKPGSFKFETLSRPCFLFAAPAAIAATFLSGGLDGVHRWLLLGPVRLHIASIVLPLLLIQLAASTRRKLAFAGSAALLSAALLILQPDGSEATAFICAALSIIITYAGGRRSLLFLEAFALLTCFTIVWMVPDRLPSVACVEGIIKMAARLHPAIAVCGIFGLAILPVPFLCQAAAQNRAKSAAALAVAVYFLVIILISIGTGAYPVIVFGYGACPILGYYLACGAIRLLDQQRHAEISRGVGQSDVSRDRVRSTI